MFYDLEDPIGFVRGIKDDPGARGDLVPRDVVHADDAEDEQLRHHLPRAPRVLQPGRHRDTSCGEAGLKLVNVSLNDINGGSIRCYATHTLNNRYRRDEFARNIKAMRQEEFDLELDTDKPYRGFQERVNVHRDELLKLLKGLQRAGEADPHLRRLHQGEHHPAVVRDRRPPGRHGRRAQPRQVRGTHAGDRHPHRQRGGVAQGASRTITWCCPGTSATSSSIARRRCSRRASA